jgi:N-methylhydantoinase B
MAADSSLDLLAGGIGAFNHRDGIDYGGSVLAVAHHFSDVEKFEQVIPFLYLYRRESQDSGGHGKWRGGVTYSAAWVGHKVDDATCQISGLAKSVTGGIGMGGGYPATGGNYWYATDSEVQEWFKAGRFPGSPDELRQAAPGGGVARRGSGHRFTPADVFELLPNPGAGWGDPLERDPALVAADALAGRVSQDDTVRLYGVVLGSSGEVDLGATEERRKSMRTERMRVARTPRRSIEGKLSVDAAPQVTEWVSLVADRGELFFACASCGKTLGPAEVGYRQGCLELEIALDTISPNFLSPKAEINEDVVFRRFLCPGCGRPLDGQVCRPSDVPYNDVMVDGKAELP